MQVRVRVWVGTGVSEGGGGGVGVGWLCRISSVVPSPARCDLPIIAINRRVPAGWLL